MSYNTLGNTVGNIYTSLPLIELPTKKPLPSLTDEQIKELFPYINVKEISPFVNKVPLTFQVAAKLVVPICMNISRSAHMHLIKTTFKIILKHKIYFNASIIGEVCGCVRDSNILEKEKTAIVLGSLIEWATSILVSITCVNQRAYFLQKAIGSLVYLSPEEGKSLIKAWGELLHDIEDPAERWKIQQGICSIIWREHESLTSILPTILKVKNGYQRACILRNYYCIPPNQRDPKIIIQMSMFLEGCEKNYHRVCLFKLLDSIPESQLSNFFATISPFLMKMQNRHQKYWCSKAFLMIPFGDGSVMRAIIDILGELALASKANIKEANQRNLIIQTLKIVPEEKRGKCLILASSLQKESSSHQKTKRFLSICKNLS